MINLSDIPTEDLAAEIGRRKSEKVSKSVEDQIVDISEAVAGVFGVTFEEMRGLSREAAVSEARFAAWLVLRDRGFQPFEIAPVYKRLDRGTIRHGCERGRALIQTDRKFAHRLKMALDLVAKTTPKEEAA